MVEQQQNQQQDQQEVGSSSSKSSSKTNLRGVNRICMRTGAQTKGRGMKLSKKELNGLVLVMESFEGLDME